MPTGRVARLGMWMLESTLDGTASPDRHLENLISRIPCEPAAWREIVEGFECDIFFGADLNDLNGAFAVSAAWVSALAERGVSLAFDLYVVLDDEKS